MPKRKAQPSRSSHAHPSKARRLDGPRIVEPISLATSAKSNASVKVAAGAAAQSFLGHMRPPAFVAIATLGNSQDEVEEMKRDLSARAQLNPAFELLYRYANAGIASPDQVRGYNVHVHEAKIGLEARKRRHNESQARLAAELDKSAICDDVQSIIRVSPSIAAAFANAKRWSGVTESTLWLAFKCVFLSIDGPITAVSPHDFWEAVFQCFPGVRSEYVDSKLVIIGIRPRRAADLVNTVFKSQTTQDPSTLHLESGSTDSAGRKTWDTVDSVHHLSPTIIENLVKCGEPVRTSRWLRCCFEADPSSEVTQRALWHAFRSTFSSFETPQAKLDPKALINSACATFPGARSQVVGSKPYVVAGIRPVKRTVWDNTIPESQATQLPPPLHHGSVSNEPAMTSSETNAELAARASRNPELHVLVKNVNAKQATPDEIERFNAHVREIELSLQIHKRQKGSERRPPAISSQGVTQVPPTLHRNPVVIGSTAISYETARELAKRARRNSELDLLVKNVNAQKATAEEIRRFNAHIHEIELTLKILTRLGTTETRPPAESSQAPPTHASPHAQSTVASRQLASGRMLDHMRLPSGHYRPRPKYNIHPNSGVGANFHSVPYPLSLLPFKSWQALHNENIKGVVCSSCALSRPITPHQRKLCLVAERLTWENQSVSTANRNKNEEALWAVNAELEIYEPAVEDEEVVVGGRQSKGDVWYPFANDDEAGIVMQIIEKADLLSERSWGIWKMMLDQSQQESSEGASEAAVPQSQSGDVPPAHGRPPLGEISPNSRWHSSAAHTANAKGKQPAIWQVTDPFTRIPKAALPTPPSSAIEQKRGPSPAPQSKIDTLQDFYTVLDKLERTSPMAARFLEAYAERLRDEVCKDCWFKHNVLDDEDEPEDEDRLASRPVWSKASTAPLFSR